MSTLTDSTGTKTATPANRTLLRPPSGAAFPDGCEHQRLSGRPPPFRKGASGIDPGSGRLVAGSIPCSDSGVG